MNYAGIKYCDVANGPGCRTVLFVSGCRNHCEGCFQPETWDFAYGGSFDEVKQAEVLESLRPSYIRGLTVLGGEPFEPENQGPLLEFLRTVRETLPKKDIWMFTGYLYDRDLMAGGRRHTEDTDGLLELTDVLVDGPFLLEQKDITLKFRGSRNQRIIDLGETRKKGELVLWEE